LKTFAEVPQRGAEHI